MEPNSYDTQPPTTPAVPLEPEPESTSGVEVADVDKVYHPMMDNFESDWFAKYAYADHNMVGEPRKM